MAKQYCKLMSFRVQSRRTNVMTCACRLTLWWNFEDQGFDVLGSFPTQSSNPCYLAPRRWLSTARMARPDTAFLWAMHYRFYAYVQVSTTYLYIYGKPWHPAQDHCFAILEKASVSFIIDSVGNDLIHHKQQDNYPMVFLLISNRWIRILFIWISSFVDDMLTW